MVVVSNEDTNRKRSSHEEDTEPPVDRLECVLDVDPGSLGLSRNHGDILRAYHAERSRPETAQEALEFSEAAITGESSGIAPISETVSVILLVTAAHCDEGKREEHEYQDHLAAGQPEFGFSVGLDCEDI